MFLWSAQQYEEADLVLPDGARIHYVRVSDGTGWTDAIFEHVETATTSATPTAFYKSVMSWNGNGWDLRLKDGTVYVFGENAPLQAIRDRYGNTIEIAHQNGQLGAVTRVTSPHGRWFEFTYNGPLISELKDPAGRRWQYTYDGQSRLWKVTDPMDHVTEYTYDADHNMTSVKNRNGVVYVTNEYTTVADAPTPVGWVKKQTHADGGVYEFTYDVVDGKSVQTDVKDPLGYIRRVTFNDDGYVLEDRRAVGEPEERATVSGRQAGTHFVTASTLGGLTTATTYDEFGNVTSVTRPLGTESVTTTYTYEPHFHQVATITDPLDHTTTFGYDVHGNLTSITDPLQHQTTFGYNSRGQRTSVTNALQHTTTFVYQGGDLKSVTDPLSRTTTRVTDAAGRLLAVTDPLGHTTRYNYDANSQLRTVTDAPGARRRSTTGPEGS